MSALPVRAPPATSHDAALAGNHWVVDLSSLWAGPLCARLLGSAGARVIKVESIHRPDSARRGPRAFFDLLLTDHLSVAVELTTSVDPESLARLVRAADVVIEA